MAKLTIIVGMAGSGKSYLGKQLAEKSEAWAFEDATSCRGKDRRRAGHETLGEIVARLLGCKQDCIMDESHLVVSEFRRDFKKFCDTFLRGVDQEWVFFEHDALGCINNVFASTQQEGGAKPHRLCSLDQQIRAYEPPDLEDFPGQNELQPVHKRTNPEFDDEARALSWLRRKIGFTDGPVQEG